MQLVYILMVVVVTWLYMWVKMYGTTHQNHQQHGLMVFKALIRKQVISGFAISSITLRSKSHLTYLALYDRALPGRS